MAPTRRVVAGRAAAPPNTFLPSAGVASDRTMTVRCGSLSTTSPIGVAALSRSDQDHSARPQRRKKGFSMVARIFALSNL